MAPPLVGRELARAPLLRTSARKRAAYAAVGPSAHRYMACSGYFFGNTARTASLTLAAESFTVAMSIG
jgi:hypothetical protein